MYLIFTLTDYDEDNYELYQVCKTKDEALKVAKELSSHKYDGILMTWKKSPYYYEREWLYNKDTHEYEVHTYTLY